MQDEFIGVVLNNSLCIFKVDTIQTQNSSHHILTVTFDAFFYGLS